jgi:hypothetical protein
MRILDGLADVEKTSIFGTAVHAVVKTGEHAVAETLKHRLDEEHVAVSAIVPVQPSLEDVFLEVVAAAG